MGSLNKASLSQCSEDTLFLWNRQDRNWEWPSLSRKKKSNLQSSKEVYFETNRRRNSRTMLTTERDMVIMTTLFSLPLLIIKTMCPKHVHTINIFRVLCTSRIHHNTYGGIKLRQNNDKLLL